MAVKYKGDETNVAFAMEFRFVAAELEDLGETGLINVALSTMLSERIFEANGREYAIGNFGEIQVKLNPSDRHVQVILFGTMDLAGELVNA